MMLPEHGPGIIVKLKFLSCKKNSRCVISYEQRRIKLLIIIIYVLDMSVNQNDNYHDGPISLGTFMKAVDANLF